LPIEGRLDGLLNRRDSENENAMEMAQAATRAGEMVTEHIRTLLEQAQAGAAELRRSAEEETDAIRTQAAASATRMIERIQALDAPLRELVSELQREAERLTSDQDRRES
jgi:hypothetical protein